ncbi:MAG TPA: hypothetical protein PK869_10865, partial [Candidatus Hydrogenedentes bacterium]|nr:hypothetical protein [Candidatus Hydrogenedentota bacterium]
RACSIHLQSLLVMALLFCASSCGTFGGKDDDTTVAAAPSAPVSSEDSDREAKLREAVDAYIQSTGQADSDAGSRLIRRNPYYFKEYYLYPSGSASAIVDIQETESLTVPYRAQVKIDKQRFATKMHRKRDDAAADSNYFRDTGAETLTFEMRNGRWYRAGSLFVAEKTEENINGEWVPAQEEVERTIASEEESESWWQRAWSSVTGR